RLQHALGPRVAADKQLAVRHGPALDRFVEVLGREIEVAGAELLNHPRNLVDRCPPARGPPAPAVDDPLRPMRLIGVAQPAEMPLAHPQQLRRLHAAQLPRLMQPNRIDDPGHSDLRQHAIPPAQTGQIVCSQTVAELVPPVAGETADAMISRGGERPSGFWWARPRYQTWPTGCCGLESGDAKAIPVKKLILSRRPAPPPGPEEVPAMTRRKHSRPARDIAPVHPHAAAVDIGATLHVAAVRPGSDPEPVRTFGTFTTDLHRLADWFEQCGVETVAME